MVSASASVLPVVASIATLIAAVAAMITVGFARSTVIEARSSRHEARDAHDEEMQASERACQEVARQHIEEMNHRAKSLDAEIALQRVVQTERIAEILLKLVDTARREAIEPPPVMRGGQFRMTQIPTVMARLRIALQLLDALGGPRLEAVAAVAGAFTGGAPPERIMGEAGAALQAMEAVIQAEPALALDRLSLVTA